MQTSPMIVLALIGMTAIAQPVLAASGETSVEGGSPSHEALPLETLGAISAGEAPLSTVATRQNVDAVNGGNSISADTLRNGDVNFSSGAFGGYSGVGNVVVNTGNNNIIQGTLSVTVVSATPH